MCANLLEKVEGAIVEDYTSKTGKDAAEIVDMMNAETWMTAQEALDNGFIDSIVKTGKAKNAWNLSAFSNAPTISEPEPEPAPVNDGTTQTNANALRLVTLL